MQNMPFRRIKYKSELSSFGKCSMQRTTPFRDHSTYELINGYRLSCDSREILYIIQIRFQLFRSLSKLCELKRIWKKRWKRERSGGWDRELKSELVVTRQFVRRLGVVKVRFLIPCSSGTSEEEGFTPANIFTTPLISLSLRAIKPGFDPLSPFFSFWLNSWERSTDSFRQMMNNI